MNHDDFPNLMKRYRKALGISQMEAALRAEMSLSHWSRIERGVTVPSIDTIRRIAKALHVTVGRLLGEEPAEPQFCCDCATPCIIADRCPELRSLYEKASSEIQEQVWRLYHEMLLLLHAPI